MGSIAYGSLIIDSEFNIVGFNKDMEDLCPGISTGKKCFEVLAKNNKPCPVCPITAKDVHYCAKSDRCAYTDLNEVSLTSDNKLYMLTFKSVAHEVKVPSDIEKVSKSLYIQGIVNSLTGDIKDIYEIDVTTRKIKILSFTHNAKAISNPIENEHDIDEITDIYIENNVHPDDRDEFKAVATFSAMCEALKEKSSFTYLFFYLFMLSYHLNI